MTTYEEAPFEWWVCAASDYNSDDSAECCDEGLCGEPGCAYKETGKPPGRIGGMTCREKE